MTYEEATLSFDRERIAEADTSARDLEAELPGATAMDPIWRELQRADPDFSAKAGETIGSERA